jgi:hypothetical protein
MPCGSSIKQRLLSIPTKHNFDASSQEIVLARQKTIWENTAVDIDRKPFLNSLLPRQQRSIPFLVFW